MNGKFIVLRLAFWAEVGGSLVEGEFFNGGVADRTGLVGSAIDIELLFKVAWFAIGGEEIFEGGAALLNGCCQHFFDVVDKGLKLSGREGLWQGGGMNAAEKEGFIGVDIADTHNDLAVHDQRFNGGFTALDLLLQIVGGKVI